METADALWSSFAATIESHLTDDDDPGLWRAAIETILHDATYLCGRHQGEESIFTRIGCCSHWMAPHKAFLRGTHFVWPSGYGSKGHSMFGLPEFDWSATWKWNQQNSGWEPTEKFGGRRPLLLRIAVPARTARHIRAVVHTLWSPGTPAIPGQKLFRPYAFQKTDNEWGFVTDGKPRRARGESHYDS